MVSPSWSACKTSEITPEGGPFGPPSGVKVLVCIDAGAVERGWVLGMLFRAGNRVRSGAARKRCVSLFPVFAFCVLRLLAAGSPQAEDLIELGRKALGTDALVSGKFKSMEVKGTFVMLPSGGFASNGKSVVQPSDDVGNVRLLFLLPDRFRQDNTHTFGEGGPASVVWTTTRNGNEVWDDRHAVEPLPPNTSVSVDPLPPVGDQKAREVRLKSVRLLLALALYVDPAFPLRFTRAGVAEAPDGRADVLDVTGADGFNERLFLDEKSHFPLMLAYADGGTEHVEELRLGEYEKTEGISFPHLVTVSRAGTVVQQFRLEKFDLKAKVTAADFQKK